MTSQSVGHQLTQKALSFGGNKLTLTDVALHLGHMHWQGEAKQNNIDLARPRAQLIYDKMVDTVEEGIDKMKTSEAKVPLILVGGGSALLPDHFQGVSQVVRPEHFEVANAIGVALGDISGQLDKIIPIKAEQRDETLAQLILEAKSIAIEAGACPVGVEVIEKSEVPLSYLQGNMVHVKIKAAGKIA